MNNMQSSERWITGALLAVSLLTFFFPLASLQLPVLGNQDVSGYELVAKGKEFSQTLDAVKSKELSAESPETSQLAPGDSESTVSHSSMPLSVQALPLIPVEIIISFGCALIALFCCVGPFGSSPAKAFSTLGSVAAIVALLHLSIANSDLHAWFREQMKADSSALANNPFAGLAQQIANLAVNSIKLKPGTGLYVLASTLSLASILLLSKVFSQSSTVYVIDPNHDHSNGNTKTFGIAALLIVIVAGIVVLVHKPQTRTGFDGAKQAAPPMSQNSDIFRWPINGLPTYIANALNAPDLSPSAPTDGAIELILGTDGQKQFIPSVRDEDCMGSGGCIWKIEDAITKRDLLEDSQGELHKTQKLTNGYYDLVVEGKLGLYLYEYRGGKYIHAECYERSNGLGSPARLTQCQREAESSSTPEASKGYPVPERTFVDAYVIANSGRDDLSEEQLGQLGHDEYTMGRQIDTQTLLIGGDILHLRGKRAMEYLDKLNQQLHHAQ